MPSGGGKATQSPDYEAGDIPATRADFPAGCRFPHDPRGFLMRFIDLQSNTQPVSCASSKALLLYETQAGACKIKIRQKKIASNALKPLRQPLISYFAAANLLKFLIEEYVDKKTCDNGK
jgi:hypothetical protein